MLLLGAVVGVASVLVHGRTSGLVLAIVASAAAAYALPGGPRTRLPFCLGWQALPFYSFFPPAGGGYLIAGDVHGYTLLGFGAALLVFGLVTVRLPPRRPAAATEDLQDAPAPGDSGPVGADS